MALYCLYGLVICVKEKIALKLYLFSNKMDNLRIKFDLKMELKEITIKSDGKAKVESRRNL